MFLIICDDEAWSGVMMDATPCPSASASGFNMDICRHLPVIDVNYKMVESRSFTAGH